MCGRLYGNLPLLPMADTPLITQQPGLDRLGESLAASEAIGMDTEFLRERTYRAQLCLLQLSTAHEIACVDPIAQLSLAALKPMMAGGPVKVLHAARQDLEVLWPLIGRVAPVFDTQVAASLAGFPAQVGYAELVRQLLGVSLEKAHTRTDWSRRPLSAEQLDYAGDDVRYLLPLRDLLLERLRGLGREAWLHEELREIDEAPGYEVDPTLAWRRLRGIEALDAGRQQLARSLATWRERRAIDRDKPRGWILEESVLRDLIARVPRDEAQLRAIEGIPDGVVKHSGAELLQLVAQAGIEEPPPPLPRRARPDPAYNTLVKKLSGVTQARAAEIGITAEVLATRRDLERLAGGDRVVAPLQGWRREVLGEQLLAAL